MSAELTADQFRAELLDLIGRAVPFVGTDDVGEPDDDHAPLPDGGVPTAVLLVVEWQGADGLRWMSCLSALGSGQRAPTWTRRMLADEALHWDDQ